MGVPAPCYWSAYSGRECPPTNSTSNTGPYKTSNTGTDEASNSIADGIALFGTNEPTHISADTCANRAAHARAVELTYSGTD